jgi:hypothetical protein
VEENFKNSISGIYKDVKDVSETLGVDEAGAERLILIYEDICIRELLEQAQKKKSLFFRTN